MSCLQAYTFYLAASFATAVDLSTQLLKSSLTPEPSSLIKSTSQSVSTLIASVIPTRSGPSIHHGTTVEDLSTAVYTCIAITILLFIAAVVLSTIIFVLSYKQRRLYSVERAKIARKQSDQIWSAAV